MRTIERKIINTVGVLRSEPWRDRVRQLSKRDQVVSQNGNVSVYLWGTKLADVGDYDLTLFSSGYRSPTTKSRLNALLRGAGCNCWIYQKNFVWYLHDRVTDESTVFTEGCTVPRIFER